MPHIPKTSIAPSALTSPGMVPRAPLKKSGQAKPAMPYSGGDTKKAEEPRSKNPMMGEKLSMEDWDVDPMKIMNQLVGDQKLTADEYSKAVQS